MAFAEQRPERRFSGRSSKENGPGPAQQYGREVFQCTIAEEGKCSSFGAAAQATVVDKGSGLRGASANNGRTFTATRGLSYAVPDGPRSSRGRRPMTQSATGVPSAGVEPRRAESQQQSRQRAWLAERHHELDRVSAQLRAPPPAAPQVSCSVGSTSVGGVVEERRRLRDDARRVQSPAKHGAGVLASDVLETAAAPSSENCRVERRASGEPLRTPRSQRRPRQKSLDGCAEQSPCSSAAAAEASAAVAASSSSSSIPSFEGGVTADYRAAQRALLGSSAGRADIAGAQRPGAKPVDDGCEQPMPRSCSRGRGVAPGIQSEQIPCQQQAVVQLFDQAERAARLLQEQTERMDCSNPTALGSHSAATTSATSCRAASCEGAIPAAEATSSSTGAALVAGSSAAVRFSTPVSFMRPQPGVVRRFSPGRSCLVATTTTIGSTTAAPCSAIAWQQQPVPVTKHLVTVGLAGQLQPQASNALVAPAWMTPRQSYRQSGPPTEAVAVAMAPPPRTMSPLQSSRASPRQSCRSSPRQSCRGHTGEALAPAWISPRQSWRPMH